jgi:CBS domain containing-hemolysin-like protein
VSNWLGVLLAVVLLAANAFFVGAEFAIISARRTQVQPLAEAGSRRAQMVLSAMRQVSLMLAGAQLGITVCSLGLGAIAEPAIAHLLEAPFGAFRLPAGLVHPLAFTLALALVVTLHMVLGEMVPKNLALAGPERAALWLGPALLLFTRVTKPVLVLLNWLANRSLLLLGIEPADEVKTVYTADELATLVTESRSEGLLDPEEHERITAALTMTDRAAADVLAPWSDVVTVTTEASAAAVEALATSTGRSRLPVVDGRTRSVRGFVHVKDVLGYSGAERRVPLPPSVVRPLPVVRPDINFAELLLLMRRERTHLVLVSEGGRPLGIVSMGDVLAAVVGGRVVEPAAG